MSNKTFTFSVESWSLEQENNEYRTPIFNLFKRRFNLSSEDHAGDFFVLEAPEWINVIPMTPEKEVILVEQYRFGVEQPTLEIPGGMVDDGESPEEGAERELLEETGYRADKLRLLGKVSANPAIMSNFTYCYLAENCVFEGADNPDTHERIKVHKRPIDEFLGLVKDGTIHHSIVVAAVARYLLQER